MAAPVVSPRASVHKRASVRAAALVRLEDDPSSPGVRSTMALPAQEPNSTTVFQKSIVASASKPSGAGKDRNYDAALMQAALEIRQLKEQVAESQDEISLLRGQIAGVTRDNEKIKKEKQIMETSGAKSMDASVLAEVQMQLVEAHSRNSESTQLIQTLDQAVATRDQSIMRAVTKMKEMDSLITSLRTELQTKNDELKETTAFVEEANRKTELAKLVARQYREQAEKLKLTEWKLHKAEEMMRGTNAPSSPLSLPMLPVEIPASSSNPLASPTAPAIPPKPAHMRTGSRIQSPTFNESAKPAEGGKKTGSMIEQKEREAAAMAVVPTSPAPSAAPATAAAPESIANITPKYERSATLVAADILSDQSKFNLPPKKEKKAPVRSSTIRVGGRYDSEDIPLQTPPAKTPSAHATPIPESASVDPDSPKRSDSKKHKHKTRKEGTPDSVTREESFRTTLRTYKQEKEKNALMMSSPSLAATIRSPRATTDGTSALPLRTFVDFMQEACKLKVLVHNGINFPPCSPYVVVRYGKQKRATKVILKTGTERAWDAEPQWEEMMLFSHEMGERVLTVESFSKGGATDKLLGSVKINLAEYHAFSLPRQFLLVSDILSEHEASIELRSVRITMDWADEDADAKRRHGELARSRGLFDTVRGGSLLVRPKTNTQTIAETSFNRPEEMCDGADAQPPDMFKIIIHVNAASNLNVRARNIGGQTYLQLICNEEHPDIVATLLKKGSMVDNQDNAGLTPLHTACSYGNLETVRALLGAGANVTIADHAGNTALHIAALQGHFSVVQLLINTAKGVNLAAKDNQGLTLLHKAAFGGNRRMCELVLEKSDVNAVDSVGNTPLLVAELGGQTEAADYLLTKGADFAHQNKAGETILWAALVRGDLKRAGHFMKAFNLSVNTPAGPYGNTLMHKLPLTMEEPQVVPLFTFLIQNGANVNAKNFEEKTPLFHTAYKGYAQCCKLLLYAGASAIALDKAGNTPLHFCSTTDVAKLLVPKGAKANVKNKQGNTPLHAAFAFFRADQQLVDYLLSKGSGEALAKNAKGLTAAEVLHTGVLRRLCVPHNAGDESLPECGGLYIKKEETVGSSNSLKSP